MHEAAVAKLASCERRYKDLASELAAIGYIASGSLAERHHRCGKPTCACHTDPARLHGPYWHWTAKVDGKTVNKRLTEREARLYQEWIANDRKARSLLAQMRAISTEAAAVILAQTVSNALPSHLPAPEPTFTRKLPHEPNPRASQARKQ